MKFAGATNLNRKSGVAEWRDLRFPFLVQDKEGLLRGGGRRARWMSDSGLCRYIGCWQLAYVSGEVLVGMVGDGYLHEIHPQRKGGVAAALFLADRLTVVVANPDSAGDGGGEADEPGIVEVAGGSGFSSERMVQRHASAPVPPGPTTALSMVIMMRAVFWLVDSATFAGLSDNVSPSALVTLRMRCGPRRTPSLGKLL